MVLGARVVPEKRDQGPKDSAGQCEGNEEAVLNPIHGGVAGFGGVPVCSNAREMKKMLAGELGEMVEGPIELAIDPAADDREGAQKSSVAEEEDEAKEVEKGDAEAEAGGGAPGSGNGVGRDRRRNGGVRRVIKHWSEFS